MTYMIRDLEEFQKEEKVVEQVSATNFLEEYLNTKSPTGEELEGQRVWAKYMKDYTDEIAIYDYQSVVATKFGNYSNITGEDTFNYKETTQIHPDFSVILDAHADEIAFVVNYIDSDGYLYLVKIGGSDHQIAPSKKVNVHTKSGKVLTGIIGHPAIHTRNGKDAPVNMESINVDIGVESKKEAVELGIEVGCYITYPDKFMVLNGDKYVGVGLDDKIGGYINAMVLKKLKKNDQTLPYRLDIVNSCQEEIGLRGAEMMAHKLNPNVAFVIDVCHDTNTHSICKKKEGDYKIGEGVVINSGPAIQTNLHKLVIETAEEFNIPYKRSVSGCSTGTNTDSYAYQNGGTPSILFQIPMKYMHTTVETVSKKDVDSCIEVIYQSLLKIENNHNFGFDLKFDVDIS